MPFQLKIQAHNVHNLVAEPRPGIRPLPLPSGFCGFKIIVG